MFQWTRPYEMNYVIVLKKATVRVAYTVFRSNNWEALHGDLVFGLNGRRTYNPDFNGWELIDCDDNYDTLMMNNLGVLL